MKRLRAALFLLSIVPALGGACTEPGDLFTIQGLVTGKVLDPGGTPVPQATVRATATYPLGGGPFPIADSALTDAQGSYAVWLGAGNLADARVPLALVVAPPAGSGLLPRDTAGLTVLLARAAPPRETTYVAIVLHVP